MKTLKIFQTSDIHGNIYPTNYVDDRNHGLAKVSTLIKKQGAKADHTLILDSGDLLQGNSLAFYNEKHKITNPSIIDSFNLIGYDGITLGNHEFNYGLDYLKSHYEQFNGPILCANITGLPFETKPYQIYNFEDLTIAVIGLTTNFIPNWEQPENIKGLEFICPREAYRTYEQEMIDQADIIIVNYHGGFECDTTDGETPTEPNTKENVGSHLINQFESIDIMLTGHQHRTISTETKGVVCMQPGCNGAWVSEITIDIEAKRVKNYKLTSVDKYDPDTMITNHFEQLNADCNEYLDTTLCSLDRDISVTDVAEARLNGHPFLSFLSQTFTSYMDADFVALSLFDSAIGFTKDVNIRQVNQNYPFPNTIMKIEITGNQMIEAIKQAAFYYTLKDGEISIHPSYISPKLKHFNYDMYAGLEYTVTVTEAENQISNVLVKGQPIEPDKVYTMLVSNYRYNNRGDYPIYNDVKLLEESQDDAIEIILNYLSTNSNITVEDTVNYTITK